MPDRLLRPVDKERDHTRGGHATGNVVSVVVYGDYLCPFCRRLRLILARLREAMGENLAYTFRHYPNERAHPGSHYLSRAAEAAARQGRFWQMHDRLYEQEPPVTPEHVDAFARELGLDMERFARDIESAQVRDHVDEDLSDAIANGVTGTPTFFIDGMRYDGAWDFYSMLETLQRPVAERLQRSARVFASLPASGGVVLIFAALGALICANSPIAPYYHAFVATSFGIGPPGGVLTMPVGDWFSEGLLAIFFLIVGLEIRREMTAGSLADPRAAILPVVGALGGVIAPALIYLAINTGPTAAGWSVPTATDIAFALGVLALLGDKVSTGLRVFVAALAVVDDILSVLTLAIFYPHGFHPDWLAVCAVAALGLFALNRARVYAVWPYLAVTLMLWLALHAAGVHGALAGIVLAVFLPTRPAPSVGPLLAQAATALAVLEHAEKELRESDRPQDALREEPAWDWASRNLSAASDRLMSPADRIEHALSPWTGYFILPLFAFSATGVNLDVDLSTAGAREVLAGVSLGLVFGKPLGIIGAAAIAVAARIAQVADDVTIRSFIGAACLCGIGDTVALLMADQAFHNGPDAAIAKIGVLLGSIIAASLGGAIIAVGKSPVLRTVMER